ncbi:MAG: hypothetical protein ABIG96_02450 [Candidatus Micrarchaeota archaeon]
MRELRWLAYFSLIYGGFLVIAYIALAYNAIWRNDIVQILPDSRERGFNSSIIPPSPSIGNETRPFFRERIPESSLAYVFSLPALGILLTGIAFLANGYVLMKYVREKEHKETKNFVITTLLTEEERAVYDELVRNRGESTQKQLSMRTGFSPVKTFRILQRLEAKKVVKTFPYGMTKKIVLNEKMS